MAAAGHPIRLPRRPRTRGHRDDAQIMVVEAFLTATIFLGVVSYVTLAGGADAARATDVLGPGASDALGAILALRAADGTLVLDALIADAWACTEDPSSASCSSDARAAAASRLRAYLPASTMYDLEAQDGSATIPLLRTGETTGPAVGARATHVPSWAYGVVAPTVSCRDAGASIRVVSVFLQNGNPTLARNVTLGDGVNATRHGHVWSATYAPSGSTIVAQAATRTARIAADAPVGTCAVAGRASGLGTAIEASTYDLAPGEGDAISPGKTLTVRHDLRPADGLATLRAATLDVRAPASHAVLWSIPLGTTLAGTTSWTLPATALQGCYVTELRATWSIANATASEDVVTRIPGTACVSLASGHVPPVPMYSISMRAWDQAESG